MVLTCPSVCACVRAYDWLAVDLWFWAQCTKYLTTILRSSYDQQLMVVPRRRLTTIGRRAFAVHGPMVWNSLPDDLRAQQDYESFRQGLKTWLFSR